MISLINRLLSPKSSTPAPNRTFENSNKSDDDDNDDVLASSRFQKTVTLYDWWLVKANTDHEGNRLAIAGFTSRELQAKRVFTSAPIAKSYDPFSLETSDGIYIIIKGLINKSRTLENGFSPDVFSHFNLGFHHDWKAYAEKCFMKEFEAASDSIPDAGTANLDSNAIPVDHKKVKGKRKRNAVDINKSFEYVSESTLANASKSFDSSGHAANHDTGNTNNHASTNFPPLMKSDKNNFSSLEDNLAVADTAEPSGYCVRGSSDRMANSTSRKKGNTGTAAKSKTEERSRLDGNIMKNVAPGASPVPEGSDVDNTNSSNLDPAMALGDSVAALGMPRNLEKQNLEKQKENNKSKDGLDYENINSSLISLPQDFDTNIRCPGEKSSGVASSSLLNVGHTVMGNSESRRKGNMGTKKKSKTRERASSKGITIRTAASEDSSAPKGSDVNNGNPSNLDPAPSLGDSEVALRIFSSKPKTLERQKKNDKSKKNDNLCGELQMPTHSTLVRGKVKNAQGQPKKISQVGTPRQNKNPSRGKLVRDKLKKARGQPKQKFQAGTPGQNNESSHSTLVRYKLKKARDRSKKISQAGTPRQNKNNLVKSSCGPDDMKHDCNLETAVDERERNADVVSSRKKAQRKINFDAHASPHTQERREKSSIVSPESLSLKRSRSGRLLVPSLDFWRNQIAVYDADRNITGIQEGLDVLRSPKGMKSEPPMRKRRKN